MLCFDWCPENCPRAKLLPVRARVWFRISVRIRAGGNFPRTVLIRKRHIKGGKHIAPMDFAEYLENQTFQRIAKFVMADFYEMDFMKGIVILIKQMKCSIS